MDGAIVIDRNKPVLDWIVPAVERMVNYREATVAAGRCYTEAIGIAMDLSRSVYLLDNSINTHVRYRGPGDDVENGGKSFDTCGKNWNADSYTLNIIIDENLDFDPEMPRETSWGCEIKAEGKGRKIYVRSTDNFFPSSDIVEKKTRKMLGEKGFPEKVDKITLLMHYKQAILPLNLSYQAFDKPQKVLQKKYSKYANSYPVSERDEHVMSNEGYEFFAEPLFWNGWSSYHADMLNIMAGIKDIEYMKTYLRAPSFVVDIHMDKTLPVCRMLLEGFLDSKISGSDLRSGMGKVCDWLKCPQKYRGMFLRKITKTLRYLFGDAIIDDEGRRGAAANVLGSYNEASSKVGGKAYSLDDVIDAIKARPGRKPTEH